MIDVIKLFDESIEESVGCTEPTAIGLAVAAAFQAANGRLPTDYARKRLDLPPVKISEQIEKITVRASRGIFKNALQVGIPYKDKLKGPDNAAAVGAFCDPARKLELFADLNEEKVREAATLLRAGKVNVIPNYEWDEIRIEAEVSTKKSNATAIIRKEHTNIAHIEVNGKPVFDKPETPEEIDKLAGLQQKRRRQD
ncbi:MAG: hypothetical protein HYY41_01610 [Chloroflexi bacterium]|nr:hypothetical protein [Chloroflexota bacterium]